MTSNGNHLQPMDPAPKRFDRPLAATRDKTRRAFALRDLLAILSLAALFGALLPVWLRALGNGRDDVVCLAHGRQMMRAFALYSQDFNLLPPNEDVAMPGHNWFGANASVLPGATNPATAADPRINLLAPYTADSRIWKCPADPATIRLGPTRARTVRSVSMNNAVGTACTAWPNGHSGPPIVPTPGSWLDGSHGHLRGMKFRTFGRESDFVSADETFVFIDEHPPSINDGVFGQPGYDPQHPTLSVVRWVDFPADYHGRAAGITFADGHVEMHKWRGLVYPRTGLPDSVVLPSQRMDWEWLALHTSQPLK